MVKFLPGRKYPQLFFGYSLLCPSLISLFLKKALGLKYWTCLIFIFSTQWTPGSWSVGTIFSSVTNAPPYTQSNGHFSVLILLEESVAFGTIGHILFQSVCLPSISPPSPNLPPTSLNTPPQSPTRTHILQSSFIGHQPHRWPYFLLLSFLGSIYFWISRTSIMPRSVCIPPPVSLMSSSSHMWDFTWVLPRHLKLNTSKI